MTRSSSFCLAAFAAAALLICMGRQSIAADGDALEPRGFAVVGSYMEGVIVNTGGATAKDVSVIIKSLSADERETYWEHNERLGDIGPGERVRVRVRYGVGIPNPGVLQFSYQTDTAKKEARRKKSLYDYSGDEQGYSKWFELPAGEIFFEYEYKAAQNGTVQVSVEDELGAPVLMVLDDVLAGNATREGVASLSINEPGEYRLNIVGQGVWAMEIFERAAQPAGAEAESSKSKPEKPSSIRVQEDDSGVIILTH